jgi:hypothetical protein
MALDRTSAALRDEIQRAAVSLVRTSRETPDKWWLPPELEAAAKNGESYAAVQLALGRLIDNGTFTSDKDKVRLNG